MGTDVSSFRDKYRRRPGEAEVASTIVMPAAVEVTFRGIRADPKSKPFDLTTTYEPVGFPVRYGTNPHQSFAFYKPHGRFTHIGDMLIHQIGKEGFSKTNLQDISAAVDIMKYGTRQGVVIKHVGPCGFADIDGASPLELYKKALATDPRSAFGGTVAFNREVDGETAEEVMKSFTENVVATGYTNEALAIFGRNVGTDRTNNSLRVVQVCDMANIPKYWGDEVINYLTMMTLPTAELALEIPFLSGVRTIDDFIVDPQVGDIEAVARPDRRMLRDALIGWNLARATRSNAVAIVNNGQAVGIGMGQQDRVGAVEMAIQKAKRHNLNLEGAIMVSEAFFPNIDSIDAAANVNIAGFAWPAGSRKDRNIIAAGNSYGMAMMVPKTGERCFSH